MIKQHILENGFDILAWGHHTIDIPRDNFINHPKELIKRENIL